ncbi:MAG TPA: non-homologous end-joining DNA ligase [Armatimonadota bacterium]|nr:non-homologous end-joining DNA ligase [Armatimonadota bacterium]
MLAQPAEGPLSAPEYAYEVKWDGMRVLCAVDGDQISFHTRNRIEAFTRFPELAPLRDAVRSRRAILDGEIVRLVDGKPNFNSLQRRIQLSNPRDIQRMAEAEPAALVLFDLLRAEDQWLLEQPWEARRDRLERELEVSPAIQLSPVWPDGRPLWQTAVALGLEGVMAKRRASRYLPGKRSPAWLKIKTSLTVEAIVCGWTDGSGARGDSLGALVLGCLQDGELVHIGRSGSGFDQDTLSEALRLLRPLATPECPFGFCPETETRAHWVRPDLVCEVRFSGWTNDRKLRFPVFLRWRPDKPPAECVLSGDTAGVG